VREDERLRHQTVDDVRRRVAGVAEARNPDARVEFAEWLETVAEALRMGESRAFEQAFAFLELDAYFFRSGYERARLVRAMSSAPMSAQQRARARAYVVACADGNLHCDLRALAMLADHVADNELRRALRARLHAADEAVVSRAVKTLDRVRHPGFDDKDLIAVRGWLLREVAGGRMSLAAERVVRWIWTPEWEADLRVAAAQHGRGRRGAKLLLERQQQRRRGRSGT
jgi:hypothetical protein